MRTHLTHRSRRAVRLPRALPTLALLLFVPLGLGGCGGGSEVGGAVLEVSPDFRLPTLDGSELGPPDFAGQVVLVEFWATWCVPCHKQAEVLHELHGEIDGSGVQFLAVDLGEEEATVREYVEKKPFPYPVLLDPEDNLTYEMGIYGLPTVMVVDSEGQVTYFETGLIPKGELVAELRRAGALLR